jgi:hypothetical protein
MNEDTITAADVKLVEGPRGKPDDLTVNLVFDRLDANVLLAGKKKPRQKNLWATSGSGSLPSA